MPIHHFSYAVTPSSVSVCSSTRSSSRNSPDQLRTSMTSRYFDSEPSASDGTGDLRDMAAVGFEEGERG